MVGPTTRYLWTVTQPARFWLCRILVSCLIMKTATKEPAATLNNVRITYCQLSIHWLKWPSVYLHENRLHGFWTTSKSIQHRKPQLINTKPVYKNNHNYLYSYCRIITTECFLVLQKTLAQPEITYKRSHYVLIDRTRSFRHSQLTANFIFPKPKVFGIKLSSFPMNPSI